MDPSSICLPVFNRLRSPSFTVMIKAITPGRVRTLAGRPIVNITSVEGSSPRHQSPSTSWKDSSEVASSLYELQKHEDNDPVARVCIQDFCDTLQLTSLCFIYANTVENRFNGQSELFKDITLSLSCSVSPHALPSERISSMQKDNRDERWRTHLKQVSVLHQKHPRSLVCLDRQTIVL